MFYGSLTFLFEVMIYVGLGLPLINLLLGMLGGGADGAAEVEADLPAYVELELDAPEADLAFAEGEAGGTGEPVVAGKSVPFRFNSYCLCLAFVVMGAIGIFAMETKEGITRSVTLLLGLALALLAYWLLYRYVIWPLKHNEASALTTKQLQYRHARVTFRILGDSPGKIETRDAVGAVISYRAELDKQICKVERINEEEEVIITEIFPEQGLCYVTLAQRKVL